MKPKTSPTPKPAAAKHDTAWLEWEDAMLSHCRAIQTLAELLATTGGDTMVTVDLVNETGGMIGAEVARLKKLVYARPGRGAK
jgi:hypothetical protein